MTPPLVCPFWPLFGLYSIFLPCLCLLEVPNNEHKSLILASKQPQKSNLTSDWKSIAQILHDPTFGLAILASVWPLFKLCAESASWKFRRTTNKKNWFWRPLEADLGATWWQGSHDLPRPSTKVSAKSVHKQRRFLNFVRSQTTCLY